MAGALEGVRVVDFGHYIAGPLTATMLSDQGADVIHVDPPSGPRWNVDADAFFNRGKRRIALDLKNPNDLNIAIELIDKADVVIENFRPGVMDRLGLGAKAMMERNPQLIYNSMPGFSAEDPRAGMRAWEGVLQAATDNCRARAGEAPPDWDHSRPTYTSLPFASNFAAFLSSTAIVMALIARERTGRGQRVEVPLYDAMFTLIGPAGAYVNEKGLQEPNPIDGNGSGTYRCGDGRYIQFDPSNHRFLTWFAQAAGVSHWGPDLLDATRLKNKENNRKLHDKLAELFLTRGAEEWETLSRNAGAVIANIRSTKEWLATEHARVSGAVAKVQDPKLGETWMSGVAVKLSETPAAVKGPRHLPDEDRAEILAELKTLSPKGERVGPEPGVKQPLEGMLVLDLTQNVAGPTSGRLLGEFGAEVVKINAPKKAPPGGYLNRGKRTILLDIDRQEGKQAFYELAERADAIVHNFALGQTDKLGIGYDMLKSRNDDLVYTSISAYGYGGPFEHGRGYERQGQAVSGIMERVGEVPAIIGPYNIIDVGTGVMTAFGTALALFHKVKTGQGQHVMPALALTSTFQQTPYMLDYEGKEFNEPRGWYALGEGVAHRFYLAQDGWFFAAAAPEDVSRIGKVVGLANPDLQGDELDKALEAHFASKPRQVWVDCLNEAGIAAQEWVRLPDLMQRPEPRARALSVTQTVEETGDVTSPGVSVRTNDDHMRVGKVFNKTGEEAEALFTELGLGDQVKKLEKAWALQLEDLPPAWSRGGH